MSQFILVFIHLVLVMTGSYNLRIWLQYNILSYKLTFFSFFRLLSLNVPNVSFLACTLIQQHNNPETLTQTSQSQNNFMLAVLKTIARMTRNENKLHFLYLFKISFVAIQYSFCVPFFRVHVRVFFSCIYGFTWH